MKGLYRIGVMAALATVSAVALSQGAGGPPSPEAQAKAAIETRQGLFKVIANQNGPIGAMLRNQREVDTALVTQRMERIKVLSEMIPEVFAMDTRQFKDIKTAALDGIWNSQADFKAKAEALGKAADTVLAVSKTGDKEATLKALRENIGKGCSGCHDSYRAKP
ncbi:MAG: cytochrome c [Proteobacteria bacterium]|nr:cytochrome c [Pseudomonadota bacterium]